MSASWLIDLLKRSFNDESLRCIMYIEEAKKERFVSFTGVVLQSSQRSHWMPQFRPHYRA